MIQVFVNPGGGQVEPGTVEQSRANIEALIADIEREGAGLGDPTSVFIGIDRQGRHKWSLRFAGCEATCDVAMPALPLDRVRCMPGDDPWAFPRLYVDDDSWLWEYAVRAVIRCVTDTDGEGQV